MMMMISLLLLLHSHAFVHLNSFKVLQTGRIPTIVRLSTSIEDGIREKFEQIMSSNDTKIFSSWSNYERSLPRRKYDMKGIPSYLPLYTLAYYVQDSSLQVFADEIRAPSKVNLQTRTAVKYVTAPSCSGKTSSILPAFLKTNLSHYIYIAFDNNENNNYRLLESDFQISNDSEIACNQGADFISNCIKCYLDSPLSGPHLIGCNPSPPKFQTTKTALEIHLAEKLGSNHMCLFHLDEHRKMCRRISNDGTGKDFSRGALQLLAEVSRAVVVATYTDLPLLPPQGSSEACRVPVRMPILDIIKVMEVVAELRIKRPYNPSRSYCRRLATLQLRLHTKIRQLGITSVLHRRNDCIKTETFLSAFQAAAADATIDQVPETCMQLCEFDSFEQLETDPNAAKLLLCIPESKRESEEYRQLPNLLLVTGGLLTTSIDSLLARTDPNVMVYNIGKLHFRSMLAREDYLSSTPLEAAYIWTLSTQAAVAGSLEFLYTAFEINCRELLRARLFPGDNSGVYDTSFLRPDILYYVDERDGKPTHPLADVFFITENKKLVLINITGGDARKVLQKRRNLLNWIELTGGCINGYTLYGVVLAPHDSSGKSSTAYVPNTATSEVVVVRGMDARIHLRGLDQIFECLEPPK